MLSERKTGGVLERGWAHPAGSDGSRCCRAAVMGHAAFGVGGLRSGIVRKNQSASTSSRAARSINGDQCSGGMRLRDLHCRTLMLSIPRNSATLGGPPSLAISAL